MKWHLKHREHGNKPWAVQVEAQNRSECKDRYAYFLQQGLGKTPLTFNDFLEYDDVDLAVVLAPQSFKLDWPLVPAAWGHPEVKSGAYPKQKLPFREEKYLYAMNYECARPGVSVFPDLCQLLERRRVMLVLDEATAFKNPSSETAKGVIQLAKRAHMVRILDGTPLAKDVEDYYPKFRALGQLNGVNRYQFRNTYGVMGGYMGKKVVGIQREDELARLWDPISFRALKADWRKDLPPQIIVDPIHVEMTNKQAAHYREMMDEFFTLVNGLNVEATLVLTQMGLLQQISSGIIIKGDKWESIDDPRANPKMKATFDIHDAGQGKSIIVYFYRPSGDLLFEEAKRRGLNPARLASQAVMTAEDLVADKQRFNEDPNCRTIIVQEVTGCRGHDLLGSRGNRADRMIFFENTAAYWQRSQMQDRNHRGAQDQECNIYDIVTSPMDEVMLGILKKRKDMADGMDEIVAAVRKLRS